MSTIGLDVGTTGCKAIIFDHRGHVLGQAAREYPIQVPHPGWAEQDAERVWQELWASLREAVSSAKGARPKALALSVQGEAIIPVDDQGRALRPAILGMDTRTGPENALLIERFGEEELYRRTGMPVHTINTLPKLLWLGEHQKELFQSAARFLLYEDFMLQRLGGEPVISPCLASRTQMVDFGSGDWASDLLHLCGLERNRLAPLASASGRVVGKLRRDLQLELGLDDEVLLASGGHDQACAALGSGVIRAGRAMVSTGTAEVVEVAMDAPLVSETLRRGNISVYRHVVPDLYLAMTLNHSGGLLLRWFRDTFCRWEREQVVDPRSEHYGRDVYDLILSGAPAGPTELLVLPHWGGSGTPWLDTTSKGAILGLGLASDRATVAKAILEGLCFELRVNLDLLHKARVKINELHAVGGGARSSLWVQLKADICKLTMRIPNVTEAACLGAALLAGVAAGVYPDLETAVERTVRWRCRVEPRANSVSAYDDHYAIYQQVYPTLLPLNRLL